MIEIGHRFISLNLNIGHHITAGRNVPGIPANTSGKVCNINNNLLTVRFDSCGNEPCQTAFWFAGFYGGNWWDL